MPRARKVTAPAPRADGEMTPGSATPIGAGQPNGRPVRTAVTQAAAGAGAGGQMPYGEAGALRADAAQMPPPPPGIKPATHAAHLAAKSYRPNVTPLFAPTQNPAEPVTAGAPLAPGPTHPMALPMPGQPDSSVALVLQQAADASGSPQLRALAARAQAVAASPGAAGGAGGLL